MNSRTIIEKIKQINVDHAEYTVFQMDEGKAFYGKDIDKYIVFMLPSNAEHLYPLCQETKSLKFFFNKKCNLEYMGVHEVQVMHVLTCKELREDKLEAFIRLTYAFSAQLVNDDQLYLPKLFSSLSSLFDKEKYVSENELQGFFAELYSIVYFEDNGCDISTFWQSRDKMKFDFFISDKKRIEIKSTVKPERSHHFRHEQLLSEIYNIRVVSMMLQKSDRGLSITDLVNKIRERHECEYALLMHIEATISKANEQQLEELKYDETYMLKHIRFYDAEKIPHISEKTQDGVFNIEYDCNLENAEQESFDDIKCWIDER